MQGRIRALPSYACKPPSVPALLSCAAASLRSFPLRDTTIPPTTCPGMPTHTYAVPSDLRETTLLSSPKTRWDHIARAVTQGSKLLVVTGVRDEHEHEQVTAARDVGRWASRRSFETCRAGHSAVQPFWLARPPRPTVTRMLSCLCASTLDRHR